MPDPTKTQPEGVSSETAKEIAAYLQHEPTALWPENAVAAIKLPVPVSQFARFAKCFPKHDVRQIGEWLVIAPNREPK
jgi:hypothetical protein